MQPIQTHQKVWKQAVVTNQVDSHTYEVTTDDGRKYMRNRQLLQPKSVQKNVVKETPVQTDARADNTKPNITSDKPVAEPPVTSAASAPSTYVTKSGRLVKPVRNLDM